MDERVQDGCVALQAATATLRDRDSMTLDSTASLPLTQKCSRIDLAVGPVVFGSQQPHCGYAFRLDIKPPYI